jgi:hypothetical protein
VTETYKEAQVSDELQVQTVAISELETSEINMQVQTAKRFPRNMKAAVASAKQLATTSRAIAQSCIYFRPVGKKDGRQAFAEGGSIRLAEIVQSQWGNMRVGSRTLGVKDGKLLVQGVCHDLEKNLYLTAEVAKSVRRRDGNMYSDGQIEVVNMAAQSIARRNAVFSVIPKALIDDVLEAAKNMIVGDDVKGSWQKAKAVFKDLGANAKDLLAVVGCESEAEVGRDEIVKLHGLYNVIQDGICPFDEVFGHSPKNEKRGATETFDDPAGKAAPESKPASEAPQTVKQRYNTVAIKLAQAKTEKHLKLMVGEYEKQVQAPFAEMTDEMIAGLCDFLESVLPKAGANNG